MKLEKQVCEFMDLVKDEHRLGPTHVSLYLSILITCYQQTNNATGVVKRKRLMQQAKIYSCSTYHKCLKELCELGYIKYQRSFDASKGSSVTVRKISM